LQLLCVGAPWWWKSGTEGEEQGGEGEGEGEVVDD